MKKTLILLVGALVLLAAMLLKKGNDEQSMRSDAPVLDSARKVDVKFVTTAKRPDSAVFQFKDGSWQIVRDGFTVDTSKVNKLLKNIFSLQDREKVSNNPTRYSEYGLDSVEARHIILKDGAGKSMADVIVGKTSGADYSSTYWRWADKPDVFRSPGNFSWEIGTKDEDWKDRKLFHVQATDVKSIETTWKDSLGAAYHFKLETTSDSTWKMLEPQDSNRVKIALASDMAGRLSEMAIDEFVAASDSNLANVKIDSPMVEIKVTFKNGKSGIIKAGQSFGGFAYALHPARKDLVKLSTWRFDAFKKRPFELLEAAPVPVPSKPDTAKAVLVPGAAESAKVPSATK